MRERPDALRHPLLVDMNDQVKAQVMRQTITKLDHLPELPGGIHMKQGEGRLARIKSLHRQVEHHRRIFADRIEHDRPIELRGHFPNDVDALGFQLLEMGEFVFLHW